MNNEQKLHREQSTVMPPPFRQNDEPQQDAQQQPGASPTLADRIAVLGLDEENNAKLRQLTDGIDPQNVSSDLLDTLARGVTHDNDVENADAAGYLRGRNEKIEAVLHPEPDSNVEAEATPVFPRYCRRSIWD